MALFDLVLSRPWRNTLPFDGRMAARSRRSRFTLLAGSGPAPARTSAGVRSMEHASRRCGRAGSMPRGPSMSGWPGVHRWPVRSDSTRPVGTKAGRVDRVDRGRSFNQNLSCRWSGLDGHASHGSSGPRGAGSIPGCQTALTTKRDRTKRAESLKRPVHPAQKPPPNNVAQFNGCCAFRPRNSSGSSSSARSASSRACWSVSKCSSHTCEVFSASTISRIHRLSESP